MEDAFIVGYQQTKDEKDLEYAYFGIFDGHGGREAALYAKEHLLDAIVKQSNFWSNNDDDVLRAIKDGFIATHLGMWKEVWKWPKTLSGLPSTSGTTASVAFIRKKKIYIGHVGDSRIVLGYESPDEDDWLPEPLTKDHKPESPAEKERIYSVGGLVMNKSGVDRVVWNRPQIGHKGPVRRSTHFDQIPFLAVARSLGDLWSYNYFKGKFVVSPEPDVCVVPLDSKRDRCIIIASDGLWNMIGPREAVRLVQEAERENEGILLEAGQSGSEGRPDQNPSKLLVDEAMMRWSRLNARADNTSVVTVMLDPSGPSHSEVLLRQKVLRKLRPRAELWDQEPPSPTMHGQCERIPKDGASPADAASREPAFEMHALPKPVILTPKRVITTRTRPECPGRTHEANPPQTKRPAEEEERDGTSEEMQENQPGTKRHSPRSEGEPPHKLLRPQNGSEPSSTQRVRRTKL